MIYPKLYMLLLGCKPDGRHTEQHDILFAIGTSLKDLIPQINDFWKDASKIHIDSWREVTSVNNNAIEIVERKSFIEQPEKLFFINLGGYKPNEFEEFHYKVLAVNAEKSLAIQQVKETVFYKQKMSPHIDDKYGVDVDDIYDVEEILPAQLKEKYALKISHGMAGKEDELHIGYVKLNEL
ncbi:hypothetical protein A9P82_06645 [Arachidicoccus ginsenosidimutans]|uniref:DUF1543 domain-containing protein n=1 Tax=Arachidicoccus sp. BS20 TaxID=1850526 RepID=UPI0007F11FCE|nr:DUF1543 domain-containing protein [Arachidicoccus sp. BS20]ANI90653.1 hypothetical protein A9P82_06645 [Arachidicoccus sp. BS20]